MSGAVRHGRHDAGAGRTGGLLVPLPVFPNLLQDIAKVLPTDRLADLGRAAVTGHALTWPTWRSWSPGRCFSVLLPPALPGFRGRAGRLSTLQCSVVHAALCTTDRS